MTIEEMKKWIDESSYEGLLQHWRFAPLGKPLFVGEIGDYYEKIMIQKGEEIGNDKRVQASKNIGRER
jgi:hypothetical protein